MDKFLIVLGQLSLLSAVFFGLYRVTVGRLGKRLSARCRYGLCLLVLARMLLPWGISLPSFVSGSAEWAAEGLRQETAGGPVSWEPVREVQETENPAWAAAGTGDFPGGPEENRREETRSGGGPGAGAQGRETVGSRGGETAGPLWTGLFGLWAAGAAIRLSATELSYRRLTRHLRRTSREADPEVQQVFARLYRGRRVTVRQNPYVRAPLLCGLIRPRILLPERREENLGQGEGLEYILRHELVHVRRWDLLWKRLAVLGTALHWFNPVLWLYGRELNRRCELACDEAVLEKLDASRRGSYGETLLAWAAAEETAAPGPLVTGFCREKEELKERLEGIVMSRKKTTGMLALSVAAAVALSGCGTVLAPDQTVWAEVMSSLAPESENTASEPEASETEGLASEPEASETEGLTAGVETWTAESEGRTAGAETEASETEGLTAGAETEAEAAVASEAESLSPAADEAAEEEESSPLLAPAVRENQAVKKGGYAEDPEQVYYQPVDTVEILAAGQPTELTVQDWSSYIFDGKAYEEPPYDVEAFAVMASDALDHLYSLSGFRSDRWSVFWSEDFYMMAFALTDDPDHDSFYEVCFQNGYLQEAVGLEVEERYISSLKLACADRNSASPIQREQLRQPENLAAMTEEEAALWYYEEYSLYPGSEAAKVQATDTGNIEIYTVEGTAYYVDLTEGNGFLDIYGPYPDRSGNQWVNLPADGE